MMRTFFIRDGEPLRQVQASRRKMQKASLGPGGCALVWRVRHGFPRRPAGRREGLPSRTEERDSPLAKLRKAQKLRAAPAFLEYRNQIIEDIRKEKPKFEFEPRR